MTCSKISLSDINPIQKKHNLFEKNHFSPQCKHNRMLKDCLLEDSNSCSSNGFKSLPRHIPNQTLKNPKPNKAQGLYSAVINAVKRFHSSAVNSPSILPKSLSRKLSKKKEEKNSKVKDIIKVKDIVRWRSFVEEKSQPLDFSFTTTESTSSNTTPDSSNCSSWCDSDFTSDFLPVTGESKRFLPVGRGDATSPKENSQPSYIEKNNQHRKSFFDFLSENQEREDAYTNIQFDSDNVSIEIDTNEKQTTLLRERFRLEISLKKIEDHNVEHLLIEFFDEKLSRTKQDDINKFFDEWICDAKNWLNCENRCAANENGTVEQKREACVRNIYEEGARWNKFDEEQEEIGFGVENEVLDSLLDDIIDDLNL